MMIYRVQKKGGEKNLVSSVGRGGGEREKRGGERQWTSGDDPRTAGRQAAAVGETVLAGFRFLGNLVEKSISRSGSSQLPY